MTLPIPHDAEQNARDVAALVAREVAELPDRTSPPDEPMLLLVTERELVEIIEPHLTRALLAERRAGMAQACIKASEAPIDKLPPCYKPTAMNREIWAAAHGAGVMRATYAIRVLLPPLSPAAGKETGSPVQEPPQPLPAYIRKRASEIERG